MAEGLAVRRLFCVRTWRQWSFCFGCVISLCLMPKAGAALRTTTNYYRVTGDSVRQIRRSINTQRPWRDRFSQDAQTRWEIRWSYSLRSGDAGCYVQSLQTDTTITITLPLWAEGTEAPEDLREHWKRYLTALKAHEEAHKRIALDAHEELNRRLRSITAVNCDELKRRLDLSGKAVIAEFRRKDEEYDRRTRHGATEGAHFP